MNSILISHTYSVPDVFFVGIQIFSVHYYSVVIFMGELGRFAISHVEVLKTQFYNACKSIYTEWLAPFSFWDRFCTTVLFIAFLHIAAS